MTRPTPLSDEHGIALPLALMTLLLLTSLMMSFAALTVTEPVIAANHLRVAQARALAESGFERAVWALANDADPDGVPDPMVLTGDATSTPAAPWNGQTFMATSAAGSATGGFTVAVRNDQSGADDPRVREITATGWTPTNDALDARTKAHRTVFGRVVKLPGLGLSAPCALCVKGMLSVAGNARIDGTNRDSNCGGDKYGTYTMDATATIGAPSITGGAGGIAQHQPASSFGNFTYSSAALDQLKQLARRNGTYFGPGYLNGGFTHDGSTTTWGGTATFNSGNRLPNGVVFVDTTDGRNVSEGTDGTTLASVDILDGAFTGAPNPGSALPGVPVSSQAGEFKGFLVVNGSLAISGALGIAGVVYAVNHLTYLGTGMSAITGLVISQNVRDATTTVDTSSAGSAAIVFDCDNARGVDLIPPGFGLIAGSFRELNN